MGSYRHPNHCRCGACRREIATFETGLLKADAVAVAVVLLIAAVIWIATAPLRIWHTIGADGQEHPDAATWIAYGISGGLILAVLMFFSIRATRETPAEAAERSHAQEALKTAADLAPPPAGICVAPPACGHPNARPLTNRYALGPVAWFCEECAEGFPPEFGDLARSCCGTAPGTPHMHDCPHRER